MDRLTHVWIGALLSGAFLVLSVHAYYIIKERYVEISKKAFKIALTVATILSLSQLLSGHKSAHGVSENQPAKLAAMEGHFEAKAPADMYVLGWVDKGNEKVIGLKIRNGLSFLIDFNFNSEIAGLHAFPEDERPSQINAIFQFYHLMVAIGMALIALTLVATFLQFKGKLFNQKWLMTVFVFSVLLPQIANQVGWFTAEMGRQPWVVYGLLRTSDALSKSVSANQVLSSLIMFFLIYTVLFLLFIYLLDRKIKHGPYDETDEGERPLQSEISKVVTR
jgi:cytochrome d ubiquinol oxidase subunit I